MTVSPRSPPPVRARNGHAPDGTSSGPEPGTVHACARHHSSNPGRGSPRYRSEVPDSAGAGHQRRSSSLSGASGPRTPATMIRTVEPHQRCRINPRASSAFGRRPSEGPGGSPQPSPGGVPPRRRLRRRLDPIQPNSALLRIDNQWIDNKNWTGNYKSFSIER